MPNNFDLNLNLKYSIYLNRKFQELFHMSNLLEILNQKIIFRVSVEKYLQF